MIQSVATEIFVMDGGSTDGSLPLSKTMKMIWRVGLALPMEDKRPPLMQALRSVQLLLCAGTIQTIFF